jgi:hypothetical protein
LTLIPPFSEGRAGKAWEPSNKIMLSVRVLQRVDAYSDAVEIVNIWTAEATVIGS